MTPLPLYEATDKEFDKLLDSAKTVHVGGSFNGNHPVTFQSDEENLKTIRDLLREPIKTFIHSRERIAIEWALGEAIKSIESYQNKQPVSRNELDTGYNLALDSAISILTDLQTLTNEL